MSTASTKWLNRTVLGVGLASLLCDWSHEIATSAMPVFLASMGVGAAWVGAIEGISDGVASFAKMGSGYFTDRLEKRKPVAVLGYFVTAVGTAAFGLATQAWHVLTARSVAWLGRGVRTPVRKALLVGSVDPSAYGRAVGLERMMDTVGAIAGPLTAFYLLHAFGMSYRTLFFLTLIPGLLAVAAIAFLIEEKVRTQVKVIPFGESLRHFPPAFRGFLVAVGLFGLGDFAATLLILYATQSLTPSMGAVAAGSAAVGLYVLHNVVNAVGALVAGWMTDHMNRVIVVALGFLTTAIMALGLVFLTPTMLSLAMIFSLAGFARSIEETAQDALTADLVPEERHGMAFGTLETVTGIGDTLSSVLVGLLWSAWGAHVAFIYSAAVCVLSLVVLLASPRRRL